MRLISSSSGLWSLVASSSGTSFKHDYELSHERRPMLPPNSDIRKQNIASKTRHRTPNRGRCKMSFGDLQC
jgi:hypothetical protein